MAMPRAGLKKVTKTVRGKKGAVRRTYWVKGNAPPGKQGFLRRHKGKLLAGAALVGAGVLAHRNRLLLKGAYHGGLAAHHENKTLQAARQKFGLGAGFRERARHVLDGARTGAAVGAEMTPARSGGFRRLRQATKAFAGRNVSAYLAASNALQGYRD